MDNPLEVGADRLLDAIGARLVMAPPLIVLDIGTATTFDLVDADGNFAGGVIYSLGPNGLPGDGVTGAATDGNADPTVNRNRREAGILGSADDLRYVF